MSVLTPHPGLFTRLRWQLQDSLVLARRNLAHVRQIPEKLIDVTLQPVMFVLLFAYVFGGVIHVPGGSYHEYLLAGIAVQTIAFGIMGPGASIATDLTEGIVDRFRSLPMARSAYLLGHMIAELATSVLAITVLAVSGLVIGWRIHTGVPEAVGGFALLILIAFTMLWIGTGLGVTARSPDAVQGIVFILVFPADFRGQRVRADRRPPGRAPDGRPVQPDQRLRRGDQDAVRQSDGDPPRSRVADGASGGRVAGLVRGAARDRGACDAVGVPQADHGVNAPAAHGPGVTARP